RGGRVGAVAGDPVHRNVFYFGSTGGGVWKTEDGGLFWQNVSDRYFKRASVGAIAVASADPNVVYVGMGECCIRGNVSHGDGAYKSTDGGRTWTHLGLERTRNIAKLRVHPRDPNLVYVAALGHAHGPNPERGVYRSKDGGKTWERVLFRSEKAGAIDLSMDPNNPRVLYAAFWETVRRPWELVSGGPGSGIFKSTDGGDTWTEITRAKGLPKGVLGRIGVAASPARENRVYAIVEAADGAVFRSDDGGVSWEKLSQDRNLRQRAWYYHHIIADPQDADTVWVLNVEAWRSIDAGKTFERVTIPHGDHPDLWIDPKDHDRMINGNDGGGTVTFNGGRSWSTIYNQPTCEFYHVTTDTRVPYRVYGAQQDNTTISVPNRSTLASIMREDAIEIGGGESGYIAVRPDDPDVIYAGSYLGFLTRYDHRTGQSRNVMVWPDWTIGWGAKDAKYRFQWTFPVVISPHDPNTLYACGNRVFRSMDEGASWQAISPDLTRNDASKLAPSGGPVTKDNTGAEYYCTIFAFAESSLQQGLLWAGSDDGLVHVSRDGGKSWRNVTPKGLPAWATIRIIEPSPHSPGTCYVAAERYRHDDFRPYFFKTDDYGRTWTKIVNGIPDDDFARVIRCDPERRGLLYAGTETGLYVSFADGARWLRWQANLPHVPIHDMVVKDSDLVLGTHGRGFWLFDDLTVLREWSSQIERERARVFAPRPTIHFRRNRGFGHKPVKGQKNYRFTAATMHTVWPVEKEPTGEMIDIDLDGGKNPPDGVMVTYWLREKPKKEVTLAFLDARGREVRTFTSKKKDETPDTGTAVAPGEGAPPEALMPPGMEKEPEEKEPRVPREAGLNRFVWNMRYPDARKLKGDKSMEEFERALAGPLAVPGTYRVRLKLPDGATSSASFEIRKDPRAPATQQELQAQFDLLLAIRDKLTEMHEAIDRIREMRTQVGDTVKRVKALRYQGALGAGLRRLTRAAETLKKKLTAIEDELVQFRAQSRQDTLNYPIKLNAKVGMLVGVVGSADAAPTKQSAEVFAYLSRRIDEQLRGLRRLDDTGIKEFNRLARQASLPAIVGAVKSPAPRRRRLAAAAAHR
ncbi:MAG: VPS10 domain-containing protein, partial [Armatimonadota bacterium]